MNVRFEASGVFLTWSVLVAAVGGCAGGGSSPAVSAPGAAPVGAARRTPLVELIQRVAPSVVDITNITPVGGNKVMLSMGAGSILHESGYILTNSHAAQDRQGNAVTLSDGRTYPFRIAARLPNEDLAVIKINPAGPLATVKVGRSSDLMLGEPVLVIGNPHGLRHTVAPGIVSGLNRPSRSTMGMIQINAAVNPGNSGGPVFNALGEMIGIVQKKMEAENISFAIPADRVRQAFPMLLSPEQQFCLVLGMDVDTMGPAGNVTRVVPGSPAHAAGVQVGDLVRGVGGLGVRDGLGFYLSLAGQKAGQPLSLELQRGGKVIQVSSTPGTFVPPPPVQAEGLQNGLRYAAYVGTWDRLPDFEKLKPVEQGTAANISHTVFTKARENFALRFTGFVRIPADGLYFFYTVSDDGSKLYIGDQLVVDNDFLHPSEEAGGPIRLKAGLYPVTVTFFQGPGDVNLKVAYEGPNLPRQEIPPQALFSK